MKSLIKMDPNVRKLYLLLANGDNVVQYVETKEQIALDILGSMRSSRIWVWIGKDENPSDLKNSTSITLSRVKSRNY